MIESILRKIQSLLSLGWSVLTSNRFKAFYWSTGTMALAGFLDLILQNLTEWDANNIVTVVAGLVFAQITKALSNVANGKSV